MDIYQNFIIVLAVIIEYIVNSSILAYPLNGLSRLFISQYTYVVEKQLDRELGTTKCRVAYPNLVAIVKTLMGDEMLLIYAFMTTVRLLVMEVLSMQSLFEHSWVWLGIVLSFMAKHMLCSFLLILLLLRLSNINCTYFINTTTLSFTCMLIDMYSDRIHSRSIWIFRLMSLLYTELYHCTPFKGLKVAFIADGNRRFLKKHNLSPNAPKSQGIVKIYEIVNFAQCSCLSEISFFCFSLKNFSRSPDEISNLMNIVTSKQHCFYKPSFRVRVYGCLNLLPVPVATELLQMEAKSNKQSQLCVNIFFGYSASNEGERKFNNHVDLLIRTSGERRLSDFMVRQVASGCCVFFAKCLWPELSIMHVRLILLKHLLERRLLGVLN